MCLCLVSCFKTWFSYLFFFIHLFFPVSFSVVPFTGCSLGFTGDSLTPILKGEDVGPCRWLISIAWSFTQRGAAAVSEPWERPSLWP